ncbi:preprotein translocase subunit YajC [Cryptosporangium phraense]|uniref:preprotein translocase subunit YajC n=1 Tax=Cryptosporangium phraense TaxID=2593070 RepID=UPI00197ACB26|nr:preprotein translocase subunit YajC [Cryptosporangium phraense]
MELEAAQQSSGGGSILPLLLLVGVFALMYFLVIRPQSQRRKQMTSMQNQVEEGAPVMTLGGLYGTVVSTEGDSVLLEVSPGVTNRYARAAIAKVLSDEEAVKAGMAANEDAVDEDDVPVTDAVLVEEPEAPAAPVTPAPATPAAPASSDIVPDPTADPRPATTDAEPSKGTERR